MIWRSGQSANYYLHYNLLNNIQHRILYICRDGRRRIDMVLVYQEEYTGVMTELEARRKEQRRVFQQNLLKEGLQLELEPKENSFDGKTYFLKLHIPWKIKVQYAEVMNLKLPTKRFITISVKAWVGSWSFSKWKVYVFGVSASN